MENLFFFSGSITSFFIVLLLSKRNKAIYDWFLLAWFSVILFHIIVFYLSSLNQFDAMLEISSAAVFLNGPILWLYTKHLFNKRFYWKQTLHFVPFLLNVAIIAPYLYQNTLAPFSDLSRMLLSWAKLGSILIYSLWSIQTIKQNLGFAKEYLSNVETHHVKWLTMALKLVLVLWSIGFFSQLVFQANLFELNPAHEDILLNISVSILVIFMGYYGFRQAPVFVGSAHLIFKGSNDNEEFIVSEKYQKSALKEEDLKYHGALLEGLMSAEKPYSDPDLSLLKLADQLNITTNQLSQIINQFHQKNFYDFVNSYRVEEVKKRLINGDVKHTTLLGIALDAGFNSKATFNRFFKKHTGQTPSEYLKGLNTKSNP
jgi:AraC-like DNA-binding protein